MKIIFYFLCLKQIFDSADGANFSKLFLFQILCVSMITLFLTGIKNVGVPKFKKYRDWRKNQFGSYFEPATNDLKHN